MTDYHIDEMIKEAMHQASVPAHVQKRLDEVAGTIRADAHTAPDRATPVADPPARMIRRSVQKKRLRRKAVWIAAAIAACSGITVFAATTYYHFQTKQKASYEVEIDLTTEGSSETASKPLTEVPVVDMQIGYLPEGLIDNSEEKGANSYIQPDEQGGFFIGDPIIMDTTEGTWSETFVQEHKMIPIGDKEALYVCSRHSTDPDWLWQELYIPFEEADRIVLLSGWGHASEADLLKIAKSITLTPTGGTEAIGEQTTWSSYLALKQDNASDTSTDDVKLTATAGEMANLHQIGDSIVQETLVNHLTEPRPVRVTVTDVQIADDLSLLSDIGQIGGLEQWKTLMNADGTLDSLTRRYISWGDGSDTMNEIVKEETVAPKLVYVTLEYANETGEDMQDVYFFGSLLRIGEEDGIYRILTPDAQDADDVEYDVWAGSGEMQYYDVSDEETGKNYIPEIGAGESRTVHMAWLVGEDEADHLYLSLDGALWNGFSEEMLQEGLYQLRKD